MIYGNVESHCTRGTHRCQRAANATASIEGVTKQHSPGLWIVREFEEAPFATKIEKDEAADLPK